MTTTDPANTEYVVIRSEVDVEFTGLLDTYDGQWRRRIDLSDPDAIELLGPEGIVHAYPTARVEQSPGGELAQVYAVPLGAADGADTAEAPETA